MRLIQSCINLNNIYYPKLLLVQFLINLMKPRINHINLSTVAKNYENCHYLIIIEKSYLLYQLNLYDLCEVSSDLLKMVQEEVWDNIYYSD